jgi:hypothetical protein
MRNQIESHCCRADLSTHDPYDIWKTSVGFHVKDLFNHHRFAGMIPAAALTLFDLLLNNTARLFYSRQEYPVVRALAALALLNLHGKHGRDEYLEFTRVHLRWLVENSCTGFSGPCWGLHFRYAVSSSLVYDSNTPFSTMTPYALEAFVAYAQRTGDRQFDDVIRGIFRFFDRDIRVMEETDEYLATSYVPLKDRVVINASSYAMYAYALLLPYLDGAQRSRSEQRIAKLYAFVRRNQREDGSWLYSPEGRSFIDCFHSCIVVKNLIKTNRIVPLPGCADVISRGYAYIRQNFFDPRKGLFRRFTLANKPSLIRFDLYDNAEMLQLAVLMSDEDLVRPLSDSIQRNFCDGQDIYSHIDIFGVRRNKTMLRWAVMPYLHALSLIESSACLPGQKPAESRPPFNAATSAG